MTAGRARTDRGSRIADRRRFRRGGVRVAVTALACIFALLAGALPVWGQDLAGEGGEEIRLLRAATIRESAGDLTGAEALLRQILERRPGSVPALLSLERVLRIEGRLATLIEPLERSLNEDPTSALPNQVLLRTYSVLDRTAELKRAADAWMAASPELETPYREIALVWEARGEYVKAVDALRSGRKRLGREDALSLELGDTYAAMREYDRAVEEWDRAIGAGGRGFIQVRRRLRRLPDGGARLIPALIDTLIAGPPTPLRLRAAAELAIDAGLGPEAERVARMLTERLEGQQRTNFLTEVARRSDGARMPGLAYWAYGQLLEEETEDSRMLAIRSRLAELALVVGDTAQAQASYRAIERAYDRGAPEKRQASAMRIELFTRRGEVDEALAELAEFRREFPDAAELDGLAADLAESLVESGSVESAERVLAGIRGPRSGLLRGRIALTLGDVDAARSAFLTAAPSLRGANATAVLSLATLLRRVSGRAARLLADALQLAETDQSWDAVRLLEDGAATLPQAEQPPVLDFAAAIAEGAELDDEAASLRRRIIDEHALSPEAPPALLALGRRVAASPEGVAEARSLLERLILEYPKSALVPQARRELERLTGRVPTNRREP